jgi:hypothetical protein
MSGKPTWIPSRRIPLVGVTRGIGNVEQIPKGLAERPKF